MSKQAVRELWDSLNSKSRLSLMDEEESQHVIELPVMIGRLLELDDTGFGMYAWSREPLERKVADDQKLRYIDQAIRCGRDEAQLLKSKYQTDNPFEIARQLGLNISTPDTPIGGGHVIFAQYVEPDEVTIFMDAVTKGQQLIERNRLSDQLEQIEISNLLLAHEIFHAIEYQKEATIFTRTEKIELWKKPFSNRSGLICLGEIAGMAFAKELLGISYSPYLFDVLLMYGYHPQAATALYEEIIEIADTAVLNKEE